MYYPSSQIQTNLYTNGSELVIKSNNQKYIGYYFKTSDGKYFSGKTPEVKDSVELALLNNSPSSEYGNLTSEAFEQFTQVHLNQNSSITNEYNKLNNSLEKINKIPTTYNPQPTEEDYKFGEFVRYFCKKNNELIYVEINKDTYNKLNDKNEEYLWQLYSPFKFSWKITGDKNDTYRINRSVAQYMISKFTFPFFNKFLKEDYLKFWKA